MKVLVLGATGFVGSHVARAFVEAGHEVAVGVRPTSSLELLGGLSVEPVRCDLTDRASLEAAFVGRDVVVDSAGLLSLWDRDRELLFRVNVLGTRNVVDACLAAGVGRLLYTGSVGVYAGSADPTPVDERGAPSAERFHSFHVTSMCLAEAEVLRGVARGLDAVCLHPSLCLGAGDRSLHSSWAIVGLGFSRLPFVPPGGLNLVDVLDVARAHLLAAERGRAGARYLIGGENLTNHAFTDLLAELLGVRTPRLPVSRQGMRLLGHAGEWLAWARGSDRGAYVTLNEAIGQSMSLYWFVDDSLAQRELGHGHSPIRPALERQIAWLRGQGLMPDAGFGLRDFARTFFPSGGQAGRMLES